MSPMSSGAKPPPLFPQNSNVLTTAHFLMKVLGEIQECVNEVKEMEIRDESKKDVGGILLEFVESVRWKFEEVLISAWLRGMFQSIVIPKTELTLAKMPHSFIIWKPGPPRPPSLIQPPTSPTSSFSKGTSLPALSRLLEALICRPPPLRHVWSSSTLWRTSSRSKLPRLLWIRYTRFWTAWSILPARRFLLH